MLFAHSKKSTETLGAEIGHLNQVQHKSIDWFSQQRVAAGRTTFSMQRRADLKFFHTLAEAGMGLIRFAMVYLATPKLHRSELLPDCMSPYAEVKPQSGQRVAHLSMPPQVESEHMLTASEADRYARRDAKLARSGIAADLLSQAPRKPGRSQTENIFPKRTRGAPHERRHLTNDPDRVIAAGLRK